MKTLWKWIFLLCAVGAQGATISTINVGNAGNDGTGDSVRTAFQKVNTNFFLINNEVSNIVAGAVQATNLPVTNATILGVFNKRNTDGVLEFFGIKQGTNIILYRDGSNVVVNSSASGSGSGSTETQYYFDLTQLRTNSAGIVGISEGAAITNTILRGITTNVSDLRMRGASNPQLEITSTFIPQALYADSRGVGTRSGSAQPYITLSPEEQASIEVTTDAIRPAFGALVGIGTSGRPFQTSYFEHWISASNIFIGSPTTPALKILHGNASPEGIVIAPPQSIYLQTNQTSGIGFWLKTNGYASSGWWLLSPGAGGGGGLSDGDKGDVVVQSSGSDWQLDARSVGFPEFRAASVTQRVVARDTSGSGDFEEVKISGILDWMGGTQGMLLYRGANGWTNLGAGTSGQLLQTPGPGANPLWATVGTLTDSDKGDVTVSGSGAQWFLDAGTVKGTNIVSGVLLTNISYMNGTNRGVQINAGIVTNQDHVYFQDTIHGTAAGFISLVGASSLDVTNGATFRGTRRMIATNLAVAGTNLVADGNLGNLFTNGIASSGVTNLVVTNILDGQTIEIAVWPTNGTTVQLCTAPGVQIPDAWYYDGVAIAINTNGFSRIFISREGARTNVNVFTPSFAFVPGPAQSDTTNFATRVITRLLSSVLSNLVGTVGSNVTNLVSLSTSNATSKPLTNSYTSGTVTLFGLQAGNNVTITPNASNLVISSAAGTAVQSNIVASATNNILIDFAAANIFRLWMLTNVNLTYTNVSQITNYPNHKGAVYFQQDTNGQRILSTFPVAGGLLQTNANMQPTTNANALDLLEVTAGFFTTNLLAYWPQNFQPRVAFTNSLASGGGGGGGGISDDFNRANGGSEPSLGANWTEVRDVDINASTTLRYTTDASNDPSGAAFTGSSAGSVNQYVKVTLTANTHASVFGGCIFRWTDASSGYYAVYVRDDTEAVYWYYYSSASDTAGTLVGFSTFTYTLPATVGFTITGTGNSTEVRAWLNPSADAPTSATSWDGTGETALITDNPGTAKDTGNYVGLQALGASGNVEWDNFFGGGL